MKKYQRNKYKYISHWIWFFLYLVYYNIYIGTIMSFIIALFNYNKRGSFNFFDIWFSEYGLFSWYYLAALFWCVWLKIGYIVDTIEIDEDKRMVHIIYFPLFFRRKEITFFIDDNNFAYDYHFDSNKFFWLRYIIVRYTSATIIFYERKKVKFKFHDAIGWSRRQMKEICEELEKYKKPERI
ncbi:MAG: hypothetical protein K6F29_07730 [Bacteroidales bacterium]|nr:hypothetical protein [Bacteroidales bacterium]